MIAFNKEQIKDRMVKTAARLWGLPESEIESNFDPLIVLLIDACASELERTNQYINSTQSRLLDRLTEVLLPDTIMNVQPASMVLQAIPSDTITDIEPQHRFTISQPIQQAGVKPYNAELFFTPVGQFRLLQLSLQYLYYGGKLINITSQGQRETVYEEGAAADNSLLTEFYIAVQPDKIMPSLNGLQLFFDMRSHSEAEIFYDSLRGATGTANGQPVIFANGYFNKDQFDLTLRDSLGDEGNNYSRKVCRQVAHIYERHFMHISSDTVPSPAGLPDEWKRRLPEPIAQKVPAEKLVFIRIQLSRPVRQHILDRLVCGINSFPCINRNFNSVNLRTDSRLNIVPLPVNGDFLDLSAVYGPGGQPYKFRVSADTQTAGEGEAIVRSSGIGKTNSRELRGLITSLIETIRDESAYFSRMSNEFVSSRLKDISRILIRLEDRIHIARDNKETLHYLLLKPRNNEEMVTAEYWTVNKAEEAQSMKAGSKLLPYNHALVTPGTAFALTNAVGARSGLSEKEKQYLLKRKISSDEKIVSAEDVKLVCLQLFGENLRKVETKRTTQPGKERASGFMTYLDVLLTLHDNTAKDETEFMRRQLEYILQQNASPVYPFRVLIG